MKKIITLLFMLCNMNLFSQIIYYIKPTGSDANNGTSWTTAFRTVQKALTTITSGEIWVAAGTYYPDESGTINNDDRNASFTLKNNVALYGGFAGSEMHRDERHTKANPSILSGEIQADGRANNNSFHVVRSNYLNATAVLDAFIITAGSANEKWTSTTNSIGGGMYNYYSSPTISNCGFTGNSVVGEGGGMENENSSPTLTNCSFWGNTASYDAVDHWEGLGAAINNYLSAPMLLNCSFSRNEAAAGNGNAIDNSLSSLTVINCILWDNGKEIGNIGSGINVSYSIVRGGYPGTGNLNQDPLFVNSAARDLHLQGCSPAIDAGHIAALPSAVATDADGNPRYVPAEVDMGAYEFQPDGTPTMIFVNNMVSGGLHDGSSWANAFSNLPEALQKTSSCRRSEIWVTAGTYYPTANSGDRTASFNLTNNTMLRGGFEGTEVPGDLRIRRFHFTTFSGDIDGDGTLSGNSYHVVQGTDLNSSAALDGFIITGGNADGPFNLNNDRGGGMYNERSYPAVTNCIIRGNRALNYGGGIFYGNSENPPILTNCLFTDNASDYAGGAIYNIASSPRVLQCTIAANTAEKGGGVYNISRSYPAIINSILWGNGTSIDTVLGGRPTVSYSLVQGGWTGTGNLAADPQFVINGFSLMASSPAIDAGSDAAAAGLLTDLESQPRKQGLHVDMGVYEFSTTGGGEGPGPTQPLTITCSGDFTVNADSGRCGATVDYFDSHPALVMGGKRPVTVTYTPASPGFLSIGRNTVTVTATDSTGDTRTCSFIVTVLDTIPPVITGVTATPWVLYPPNHKMQEVLVQYQTSDCTPVTTKLSVTSNEPQYGAGSGDTGPDWEIIDEHHVRLRAERSGNGTGRIYTLTITTIDSAGNTATATTTVTVPHDNSTLVKTTQRIGKEELMNGLKVQAIPNPTTDGFTIITKSSSGQIVTIQVTDNLGRIVERRTGLLPNGTICLGAHYRPGIYFMEIEQGGSIQTLKLLKQAR